jgi:CO/xanthine dehydrogenase Mo-binding subunit
MDGTLLALKGTVYMDTGAYASYGPAVGQLLTETIAGPYHIPNVQLDTFVVYTNGPIAGAMRGFGSPQTNFAYESMMDILAEKIGLDPIQIRQKNIWKPGDRSYTQVKVNQAQTLQKVLDISKTEIARLKTIPTTPGKVAGVGMALSFQTMGLGHRVPDDSTCRLEWQPDGEAILYLGAPDLGQGLITAAAQIAADALELDYSQVHVVNPDTSNTPDGGVSCASRMTYLVGSSVKVAANNIIGRLIEEASKLLKTDRSNLKYQQGKIIQSDKISQEAIPVSEITGRYAETGVLQAEGTFSFLYGPDTPTHLPVGMPHVIMVFGGQIARVEVDPDLGIIEVREIVAIHDVGQIINKASIEGQIEGGISMGIGYALSEEITLKSDQQWVDNFSEYLIPTTLDMPPVIKCIILEEPDNTGMLGVKGVGEMGVVPTAAAIANAVYNATGRRIVSIPIKPEEII